MRGDLTEFGADGLEFGDDSGRWQGLRPAADWGLTLGGAVGLLIALAAAAAMFTAG